VNNSTLSQLFILFFYTAALARSRPDPKILEAYRNIGLKFHPVGDSSGHTVAFVSRGAGYQITVAADGVTMDFSQNSRSKPSSIRMSFPGGKSIPAVEGFELQLSHDNFLIGQDRSRWRTNVPQYGKVLVRGVYPGIDVVYYGNGRQLEYDLIVLPGADVSRIRLALEGADRLQITPGEDLAIHTGTQEVLLRKPKIYQEINNRKRQVSGRYVLNGKGNVGFEIAKYDHSRALIIDPVLNYSTYFGGGGDAGAFAVATDSSGNVYLTGFSASADFPSTAGSVQTGKHEGSFAIFVSKLNSTGTGIVYSTYIGGTGDEEGYGIAVDSSGNAYVTGYTNSSDFPATAGSLQTTIGGSDDAFVLKLNPAGTALVYATYLGGRGSDAAYGVAVDASGNAYVAGTTASATFPATVGSYQKNYGGGTKDAFVSKLNSTGSQLLYSTFLGGSAEDVAFGLAVNTSGTAFVTGYTYSSNFPATVGALQTKSAGGSEAFVTALNAQGSALVYSTYLGGSGDDSASAITIDGSSSAFVTGYTGSGNFPHTNGVFQAAKAAGEDAFIAKLDPVGATLSFATFLGGTGDDFGLAIGVDSAGTVYVAGDTTSTDFPQSADAVQPSSQGGEFTSFLAILNQTGTVLNYGTYFGGGVHETAYGLTVGAPGQIFLAGYTASTDFPVTPGVLQLSSNGKEDAFVASFSGVSSPCSYALSFPDATVPVAGGSGSVTLTTGPGCSWTVTSNAAWLTVGAPRSGSGTASIIYTASTNTGQPTRSGDLTIAGITFPVTQIGGTSQPPTADSVTPKSGAGLSQTFTFKYSSGGGYKYLNEVHALINSSQSPAGGCSPYYVQANNALFLLSDDGITPLLGSITPGSAGTLQNGQCSISGTESSVSGSGNTLALNLAVTFSIGLLGDQTVYGYAIDNGNLSGTWKALGTYSIRFFF